MKIKLALWALLASITTLTCVSGISVAQAAGTSAQPTAKTPTNAELLDKLIASAKPGDRYVLCSDMLLSVDELRKYAGKQGGYSAASAFYNVPLWPGGRVPYEFDPALPQKQRDAFVQGYLEWQKVANLTFFPHTTETDYVYVYQDANGGSFANPGHTGGKEIMSLADWADKYTACHELGHTLGMLHEQSRSDRDTYITIDFTNVQAGKEGNFSIVDDSRNLGAYDFDSIMHYGAYGFAIDASKPTMICKPDYAQYQNLIGQNSHLSALDKAGMALMYGFPGAPTNDNFENASTISGMSGSVSGSNVGATRQKKEPVHLASVSSIASVWYQWTAPTSGTTTFTTTGSDFSTILAIYTGSSLSQLKQIVAGNHGTVSIDAKAGTTYFVAVDGNYSSTKGQDTGKIVLNWNQIDLSRYSLGGTLNDKAGNALSGVKVSLEGGASTTATTDATGAYSFTKLYAGNYTVTPFDPSYSFLPTSRSISLSGNATGNDFVGTYKMALPLMSVSDVAVREGDSGNAYVTATVSLSHPSTSTVTASFATADGTATDGKDYIGRSGTVTFAPNTVIATMKFPLLPDTVVEANETFFLNISKASGAYIADSQGKITIADDDSTKAGTLPNLTISDLAIREGDAGRSYATFTLSLSKPSATAVSVAFATANGTATSGSDYIARSGTVVFEPNTVTTTLTVFLTPDTAVESSETLFVNLSQVTGANLADAQGKLTIFDDDGVNDAGPSAAQTPAAPVQQSPSVHAS